MKTNKFTALTMSPKVEMQPHSATNYFKHLLRSQPLSPMAISRSVELFEFMEEIINGITRYGPNTHQRNLHIGTQQLSPFYRQQQIIT